MPPTVGGAVTADVVLTLTPYTFYHHTRRRYVTTTAYTTNVPGLLICRPATAGDGLGADERPWLIAHWQGQAIQGERDYPSPWQALVAADQLGALDDVDWRRTREALKADGVPIGLWDALRPDALADRAGDLLMAVTCDDDHDRWDSQEVLMDLLAVGWTEQPLADALAGPFSAVPLAERVRPLIAALAPLDGRPPWCGQCLPIARLAADERGWLTCCRRCHPRDHSAQEDCRS